MNLKLSELKDSSGCSADINLDLPTGNIVNDSNDWTEEIQKSGGSVDLQFHIIQIVHEEARISRVSTRIDLYKIGVLSFCPACVAFSMSTTWRLFRESHVIVKVWGPRLGPLHGGTHAYTSLRGVHPNKHINSLIMIYHPMLQTASPLQGTL